MEEKNIDLVGNFKKIESLYVQLDKRQRYSNLLKMVILFSIFSIMFSVFWFGRDFMRNVSLIVNNLAEDSAIMHNSVLTVARKIDSSEEFPSRIDDIGIIINRLRQSTDKLINSEFPDKVLNVVSSLDEILKEENFFRNVAVLVKRVKQDSDVMRYIIHRRLSQDGDGYISHLYEGAESSIIDEIEDPRISPSLALFKVYESVRNELNLMNRNMMLMGGTMSRMGSWIP